MSFAVTAALGAIELDGKSTLVAHPLLEVGEDGRITSVGVHVAGQSPPHLFDLGNQLLLPGFVNAHSHAFQRTIRGTTGRRDARDPSSFWSWRTAMYDAANLLDEDRFEEITRACFSEMLASGITCVGEFHYLHHRRDGTAHDDPNELSHRVIAAARAVGIRLVLLEVYYARAGAGAGPLPEQRRFCDADLGTFLERVDRLRETIALADDGLVSLGVAPHSVRAVARADIARIARFADDRGLPIHAHVSEQARENQESRAEHGCSPTALLADAGCLARPGAFTAVHAIHLDDHDHELLAGQCVCACPTTEADLGDGIVPARRHLDAGATLCLGSDSNAIIDLVQEARLLEMHERLARASRLCLVDDAGSVASTLLAAATRGGANSLGRPMLGRLAPASPFDAVSFDLDHPTLREVDPAWALDAVLLAGTAAPVSQVWVDGRRLR